MIVDVLNGLADNLTKDTFSYNITNSVFIRCNNRGAVSGILSGPLKLNVKAEYKEFKTVGGEAGKVIEAADAAVTALTGASVQQPWFSRMYWTATAPLSFSVSMSFIATSDAKTEVFNQVETLVGFLYPRQLTEASTGLAELYAPPGPNLFSGVDKDGKIQAPGLFGGGASGKLTIKGAEEPDYIEFRIGSMISLAMCYLTQVDVEFSPVLDPDGYPHAAKVTVSIRAFDSSYWPKEGTFQFSQGQTIAFNTGNIVDTVKKLVGVGEAA